jgi:geranylgeranyl pyrophosphate synthase
VEYMEKSFFKTASLLAHSCESTAVLSPLNNVNEKEKLCFDIGKHIGISFYKDKVWLIRYLSNK